MLQANMYWGASEPEGDGSCKMVVRELWASPCHDSDFPTFETMFFDEVSPVSLDALIDQSLEDGQGQYNFVPFSHEAEVF